MLVPKARLVSAFLIFITSPVSSFSTELQTFFSSYCIKCHGEDKAKGNLTLHDLDEVQSMETWRMIAEQIQFLDMPPEDAKQPSQQERERALEWIRGKLRDAPVEDLPEFGNYVDHDALFNEVPGPVIPATPRLWRMRPEIYLAHAGSITESVGELSQPFSIRTKREFSDYASIYFIDEPSTDMLLRNAEMIVANQAKHGRYGEIHKALQEDKIPDETAMAGAVKKEFRITLNREASLEEATRFVALWKKNIATSGHPIGSQATLMAVLMQPEVLFHLELGSGEIDKLGRVRLAQDEIARAVNFALRDRRDAQIFDAAARGELATPSQIAAHAERLFHENTRSLAFFREYFGYQNATSVFKDTPTRGQHNARILVSDLEFLISHILDEDTDVLRRLLTTNKAFVNWRVDKKRGTKMPANTKVGFETVYGLPPDWKWTDEQPITLPQNERAGVLTHPAWLVAWSGNFDNDPVRRGKWIRTHLLGGSVPDVPIGVDARIPDDELSTLRERLHTATSKQECWRCHRKMDPLGLPFEQFSHYGHFRNNDLGKRVVTSGRVDRTSDLEFDVSNPIDLMNKLADSERVEQVFVRHVFRFYLGRNETLGDAATLQNAWNAYRKSGGSFNALVTSLITSDSFLYRKP
jgi:hypothetical protein